MSKQLEESPLGKNCSYDSPYDPSLLFSIPRKKHRDEIGILKPLPFHGGDIWTAYELSWLNEKGKPEVGIGEFTVSCTTPKIWESKSIKLYLNSFNQTRFENRKKVEETIRKDLSDLVSGDVLVKIYSAKEFQNFSIQEFSGINLDELDIEIDTYQLKPVFLHAKGIHVEETLCSNLLKSNCLVTSQPDWASVQIRYSGPEINREGLLKYLVSFRKHNEFHEPCVERIFIDISRFCHPKQLTVYARFTRRGGLDINPFRSNFEKIPTNIRTSRQ